ncbi:radical SAM protein [Parasporobacterium paucivorans]|uniref:Wyosine [tRNA(Phe)-imidazoG37] synthetase, radical SAM superfamily n=1 Tax=Parasporobacterium paucivorans DSM 15970 TaxID=1122934 RepID=A0A1M6I4C9_9FIRM|nr:radical SAM protein [Parasporobacterium paucivorans]SHJ29244.1 Wyosine [tRNA(Phe)-imidazoG37] synthetase, radical SAM superfamily [Parasporobacterium paucivorans DSM 15970]
MKEYKYIYGPVPSRRLGLSLGVSPIPKKTCNYSCIYCQLGRTDHMTNTRKMFYPVKEILEELDLVIRENIPFDVITIVGEGEPTLYLGLGELIREIQKRTDKPVAVITNGALLFNPQVQEDLSQADIVLPTMDAYDEESFKKISRPHGSLKYSEVIKGLEAFSEKYKGQLWIEIMLMKDINDDDTSLQKYLEMLDKIKFEKLYLNTPVRPPAESDVMAVDHERMSRAAEILGGISIDLLDSNGFHSEIKDDYEAILSIIKRHPMNQFEIEGFLEARGNKNKGKLLVKLKNDTNVASINYKGYVTFRLK